MNLEERIKKILREEKLPVTYSELLRTLPNELKDLFFKQWNAKQNPKWHPEGNSLKHIIVVLKRAYHHYPDDPNMIMTALFHDLGKMDTYEVNPKTGQPTAYGHEFKSTDYVEQFRDWIESFDGTNVDEIKYLVKNHMKVKPSTWDSMRDSKKEPIMNNPAFDKLMGFTEKLDGGGTDLKESIRKILRDEDSKKDKQNESDPKVGIGKKPKGSDRRLYTDENPKDTVSVKFRTKQDIIDTLNKESFKSKSHARQSQIINLIHQRLRVALQRAKEPEVKKRLKTAFEYIEMRKEASKRKTQEIKESEITEKCWKGYTQKGMKTMFGKRYPNCVKKTK